MAMKMTRKVDLINNAAIRIFAEKGYHASRTLDISREAGVGYGTIYQYFKSKDDILLHIFRESWENLVKRVAKISKNGVSPADKILGILELIIRSNQNNPQLMKVLITEASQLSHCSNPEHRQLYHRFFVHLAKIFEEGQMSGDFRKDISPMIAAFVIYGAIDTTIRQYVLNLELSHGRIPLEEAKRQIMKLLIKGYSEKGQLETETTTTSSLYY